MNLQTIYQKIEVVENQLIALKGMLENMCKECSKKGVCTSWGKTFVCLLGYFKISRSYFLAPIGAKKNFVNDVSPNLYIHPVGTSSFALSLMAMGFNPTQAVEALQNTIFL